MTRFVRIALVAGCCMMAAPTLLAQDMRILLAELEQGGGRQGQGGQGVTPQGNPKPPLPQGPGPNEPFSPVYIQQMFDTMAIVEAERFLPLSPEQYAGFVQRLRRLQEARMQGNRRRGRVMNELRSLVGPQAPADVPDSAIEAKLKELAAADAEGYAGIHKAIDELDAGLNARQRARFRMLEENVERRKIDFLTKVRGGGPGGFEGIPR
jgi:hypothetical protein